MDGELHFHLNLLYVSIFDTSLTGPSVHMMDREEVQEGSFLEKINSQCSCISSAINSFD